MCVYLYIVYMNVHSWRRRSCLRHWAIPGGAPRSLGRLAPRPRRSRPSRPPSDRHNVSSAAKGTATARGQALAKVALAGVSGREAGGAAEALGAAAWVVELDPSLSLLKCVVAGARQDVDPNLGRIWGPLLHPCRIIIPRLACHTDFTCSGWMPGFSFSYYQI